MHEENGKTPSNVDRKMWKICG